MIERPEILYAAEATATGGREGHARTSDGRVEVDLDIPKEMGGTGGPGTNPEQLFAVGYAACFQTSLLRFAAGRKLDILQLAADVARSALPAEIVQIEQAEVAVLAALHSEPARVFGCQWKNSDRRR